MSRYASTNTDPRFVLNAPNTDKQKQDADAKEFAEITEKMTT